MGNERTAENAYRKTRADVEAQLTKLRDTLALLDEEQKREPLSWGYAAEAGRIARQLQIANG